MKLITFVILATLSGFAHAQDEAPWYETNEAIAMLHGPSKHFKASISPEWLNYFLAIDPITVARVYSKRPPISLRIRPTPELASFITSPERHISEEQFIKLSRQSDRLLQAFDDKDPNGQEDFIWELHAYGLWFTPATSYERNIATRLLSGFASIGRVFAVRLSLPMNAFSVHGLEFHNIATESITPSEHIVLIDIQPPNSKPCDCGPLPFPSVYKENVHARSLMNSYVKEMGHVFWRQMPQDQRTGFISQFNLDDEDSQKQHRAEHVFTDAFVIATLYPNTFETKQVEPFQVFGITPPSPPTGAFLEQIRFVDALLDPIEQAFLDTIPSDD